MQFVRSIGALVFIIMMIYLLCMITEEVMTPSIEPEQITHFNTVAARMILAALPESIRDAFERRAAAIEYPVEAVLEMAFMKCF